MSDYVILYRPEVEQDVEQLSEDIRLRVRTVIEERLMTHPHKYGQRLRQSLHNLWRVRTGDFRIVYEIDRDDSSVTVWGILHRKDIYDEIKKRYERE